MLPEETERKLLERRVRRLEALVALAMGIAAAAIYLALLALSRAS
jgi:hypothetical protein